MFRLLVLAAAAVSLTVVDRSAADPPKHKHLHYALYEMKEAHAELKDSTRKFGGHKEKAMEALHAAIKATEKALEAVGDPYTTFTPEKKVYDKFKDHPHLHNALMVCRDAHAELKGSKDTYGGFRDKAILELDAAIFQIKDCIEHDRD